MSQIEVTELGHLIEKEAKQGHEGRDGWGESSGVKGMEVSVLIDAWKRDSRGFEQRH